MPNVKVATRLREIYEIPPGAYPVMEASTVAGVVEKLNSEYPGIKSDLLMDSGNVRPDVVIYLDGEPIAADQTASAVENVNTIRIIQAMAGG